MALTLLKLFPILIFGQILFFLGIFFTSGQLLSNYLADFYNKTNNIIRLVISLFSFFAFGNYIISKTYNLFDANLVTLVNIFCTVLVSIILTIIIFNFKPPVMIIPAILLVALGCVWVNYLLIMPK